MHVYIIQLCMDVVAVERVTRNFAAVEHARAGPCLTAGNGLHVWGKARTTEASNSVARISWPAFSDGLVCNERHPTRNMYEL